MIKITDEYALDSDTYNFIIKEKHTTKKGKEVWEDVAYCGNLTQVKNWLMNRHISKDLSILENVCIAEELSKTIDKSLSEVLK